MIKLGDLELQLPKIPTDEEWTNVINELQGLEKEATVVRAKGYTLLAAFNESKATLERIGWLNLWAKTIVALESALSAFKEGLDWTLTRTYTANQISRLT